MAAQSTSSEEDQTKSLFALWKVFRERVRETHPDIPPPQAPKSILRTQGGPTEPLQESHRLPLFPSVTSAIQSCEGYIVEPTNKAGIPQDPLGVGSFLKSQRLFSPKILDIEGDVKLAQPLRRNTSWPKDVLQVEPDKLKAAPVSESHLKLLEADTREALATWSALRWAFSATSAYLEDDSLSRDQLRDKLRTVSKMQQSLAPIVEDRLTTTLTNTVLRRRDIILSSYQAKFLQEENLVDIRASPLLGSDLLDFPQELVHEEREARTSRELISALRRSSSSSSSRGQRFRTGQQRSSIPAAAGSAAQLSSDSGQQPQARAFQAPAAAPTAYPVAYQSYRKRGSRGSGSRSWQQRSRDSRQSSDSFKGSSAFRFKGRGKGRRPY